MPSALVFRLGNARDFWTAIRDDGSPLSVRIGRGRESELVVPKTLDEQTRATVSRTHARIFRMGDGIWLEDLGSVNFTTLNGQIVLAPVKLSLPAKLKVGEVEILVSEEVISEQELDHSNSHWSRSTANGHTRLGDTSDSPNLGVSMWRSAAEDLQAVRPLFDVAVCINQARRVDELDFTLKHILAAHLHAIDVSIVWDAKQKNLALPSLSTHIPESWHEPLQELVRTSRERLVPAVCTLPGNDSAAWSIPALDPADDSAMLVLARYLNGDALHIRDEMSDIIALCLRMAEPLRSALAELERRRASEQCAVEHGPTPEMLAFCEENRVWGASPSFQRALYYAEQAASRYLAIHRQDQKLSSIFVLGETGTGKSALARLIHRLSKHRDHAFEELNCAAIPDTLAESELFGYEKGSHDKAFTAKVGFFETANRGTLFLDEIGKTTKEFQSKLLKVLDSGEYRRLGGTEVKRTSCYVILAASEDPHNLIKEGKLLEELWFRTAAFTITLPPLREREGDLDLLVHRAIDSMNASLRHDERRTVSPQVLALFHAYSWPGNVRELMQYLEVAHALTPLGASEITVNHLPENLLRSLGVKPVSGDSKRADLIDVSRKWDEVIAAVEREYLTRLIRECDGNLMEVARRSDKAYQTIHTKLKAFRAWLTQSDSPESIEERARLRALAGAFWGVIERDDQ